jgi:thiol-disulfide isomerase/thioredoxin
MGLSYGRVRTNKRMLAALMFLVQPIVVSLSFGGPVRGEGAGVNPGDNAPNFNLDVLNPVAGGSTGIRLRDLVGPSVRSPARLVVIDFFAMFCKPCKASFPTLQAIADKYRPKGVQVVSILVEGDRTDHAQLLSEVRAFLAERKITIPMLVDPNGLEDLVPRKYVGAPVSLPALFVVDSAGKVREKVLGGGADVDRIIARNLGE